MQAERDIEGLVIALMHEMKLQELKAEIRQNELQQWMLKVVAGATAFAVAMLSLLVPIAGR